MWSQEVREAFTLFMALVESNLLKVFEYVAEFITAYQSFILIGFIILVILFTLDLLWKWREKREKEQINDQIEEQMKVRMKENEDEDQ
jgi:hypothetical protein